MNVDKLNEKSIDELLLFFNYNTTIINKEIIINKTEEKIELKHKDIEKKEEFIEQKKETLNFDNVVNIRKYDYEKYKNIK